MKKAGARGTVAQGAVARGTALIVDDQEIIPFAMSQILCDRLPVRKVEWAATFAEAKAKLADPSLVLAIFDLGLPDLADPRDLAEVRRRRPDVRAVVLSGRESRADILAALEAGVHGYLLKRETVAVLVKRLRHIMSGEIYVPPLLADLSGAAPARGAKPDQVNLACKLTPRQRQMLEGLIKGLSNKAIARAAGIAEGTVKMHLANLYRIIGATNRTQAAAVARRILG